MLRDEWNVSSLSTWSTSRTLATTTTTATTRTRVLGQENVLLNLRRRRRRRRKKGNNNPSKDIPYSFVCSSGLEGAGKRGEKEFPVNKCWIPVAYIVSRVLVFTHRDGDCCCLLFFKNEISINFTCQLLVISICAWHLRYCFNNKLKQSKSIKTRSKMHHIHYSIKSDRRAAAGNA